MTSKTFKRIAAIVSTCIGLAALGHSSAHAANVTSLKQVQVSDGSQVDLLFDGKVSRSQFRTEFFNDIIQVVMNDVSVYPAKISSVASGKLSKVFAYQYAPKLVRCRLTVRGKAEDYKDQLEINTSGKMVTIRLAGATIAASGDAKAEESAKAEVAKPDAPVEIKAEAAPEKADKNEELAAQDRALLDQVIKSQSAPAPTENNSHGKERTKSGNAKNRGEARAPLTGGDREPAGLAPGIAGNKGGPNLFQAFGKIILVFGLLGLLVFGVRYLRNARGAGAGMMAGEGGAPSRRLMGALSRFAVKGFGQKGRLIEVIATHYLGPKRSIHILRVAEKTLVIGVTNEAINLISELDSEDGLLAEYGENASAAPTATAPRANAASPKSSINATSAAGPDIFAQLLGAETANNNRAPTGYAAYGANPAANAAPAQAAGANGGDAGIRNRIKSRLEGLKPL